MADIAGLAQLFEKADQVTLGLTINGQGTLVTLNDAETQLVARACKDAIAKPAHASSKRSA